MDGNDQSLNYFKVFGHKYHADSQVNPESHQSSDINSAEIANKISSKAGTLKTISTCEESKDYIKKPSGELEDIAMRVNSNDELIRMVGGSH